MNERQRRQRERGRLLDDRTIQFERTLPGPIELVWDYLTKKEYLAAWLLDDDIPTTPGTGFALSQDSDRVPVKIPGEIRGEITRAEPPHVLAFTWENAPPNAGSENAAGNQSARHHANARHSEQHSEVIFELEQIPQAIDQVRLRLTHRRVAPDHIPGTGAGWHTHLEFLNSELGGQTRPANFFALYEEVLPYYVRACLQLQRQRFS